MSKFTDPLRNNVLYLFMYRRFARMRRALRYSMTQHYVVSFPKCGRTWLRFFLANYFHEKYGTSIRLDYDHVFQSTKYFPRFSFDHVAANTGDIKRVRRSLARLKGRHVCLVVRDPRDVVVSYFFHVTKRQGNGRYEGMSLSEFMRDPACGLGYIVSYYNEVEKQSVTFASYEVIRYEDLHQTAEEFTRALAFLGESPVDADAFKKAADASSFSVMSKKEVSGEINDPRLTTKPDAEVNARKVRSGKVAGYTEHFSESDLQYAQEQLSKLNSAFFFYAEE